MRHTLYSHHEYVPMAVPAMTSHSMTSPHTNGCHVPMAMGVCTQVHTGGFVERTLDSLLEPFFNVSLG